TYPGCSSTPNTRGTTKIFRQDGHNTTRLRSISYSQVRRSTRPIVVPQLKVDEKVMWAGLPTPSIPDIFSRQTLATMARKIFLQTNDSAFFRPHPSVGLSPGSPSLM